MPAGWASPGTGTMIRDVMHVTARPMYVHEIFEAVRDRITGADVYGVTVPGLNQARLRAGKEPLKPPSYDSVKVMLHACRRLGLVQFSHEETDSSAPHRFPKRYYSLNPAMFNSPYWRNPQTAYKDPEAFARMTEWRKTQGVPDRWMEEIRRRRR